MPASQAGRRRFESGLPLQKQRTHTFRRIRRYDNFSTFSKRSGWGGFHRLSGKSKTSLFPVGEPRTSKLPRRCEPRDKALLKFLHRLLFNTESRLRTLVLVDVNAVSYNVGPGFGVNICGVLLSGAGASHSLIVYMSQPTLYEGRLDVPGEHVAIIHRALRIFRRKEPSSGTIIDEELLVFLQECGRLRRELNDSD